MMSNFKDVSNYLYFQLFKAESSQQTDALISYTIIYHTC